MRRKATLPSTNIKRPDIPSGTTSSVKSVSNSGQMSTSTQSTGATGSVRNTTNISTVGVAGTTSAQPNTGTSMTNLSPEINAQLASIPGMINTGGSWTLNPQSSPIDIGEQVRGAYTQVEGALSQARARALGAAPREYHDQVNSAFDTASTQVSEHRKRLGY